MDPLTQLEKKSVYILREAHSAFKSLCMLWSIGKDSTVMLWLARKAFFGHVPFPLVHIDTSFKIPEMIAYRDRLAGEWDLDIIYGQNESALGARADEEGSRSKERYFSPRDYHSAWNVDDQPPEFWNHFNLDFVPGTHLRIHPLLDWTELNIWEYIRRESIPTVSLYYNQGNGKRYRSLGCHPCTAPIESDARTVDEIIAELRSGKLKNVPERSGRAQDQADGGLEALRRDGYM